MSTAVSIAGQTLFDAEQTPALLKLLAEYTEKLRNECDKYEKSLENTRLDFTKIGIFAFLFAIVVGFQVWLDLQPAKTIHIPTPAHSTHDTINIIPLLLTFVEIAFVVISFAAVGNVVLVFRRYRERTRSQVVVAAAQLERIVRRISPIAEHGNIRLGDKLEFDLRLADADIALEYAAQYIGEKNKQKNGLTREAVFK